MKKLLFLLSVIALSSCACIYSQVPDPGYILSSFENSVNVQIIVVDEFQNVSSTVFPVTLVDSSGPVIVYKFEIVSKRIVLK